MVAPTKRLDFDSTAEGGSVAGLFNATGGTVSLLAKATSAIRGGRGCECTGAGVSDFGSLTIASANSAGAQVGLKYSGTAPSATLDFMLVRNSTTSCAVARLSTGGVLSISDATGNVWSANGGSALPAGNYWIQVTATKGTTTSNGFLAYWLYNADDNSLIESNSSSTQNTGTAVYTVARFGKHTTGGTYTVNFDKPSTVEGSTALIDLPAAYTQTPGDSEGLTDSLVIDRTVTPADSEGLTDAATTAVTKTLSIADSIGVTDSDNVEALMIAPTIDDTAALTDAIGFDRLVFPADTEGTTDSMVVDRDSVLTDPEGLTDAVTVSVLRSVTAADPEGLTDATTLARSIVVGDGEGLTDSISVQSAGAGAVGVDDNLALTDALTIDRTVTLSDSEPLTDVAAEGRTNAAADSEGLTDQIAQARAITAADTAALTDSLALEVRRVFSDTISTSDALDLAVMFAVAMAEETGLSDHLDLDLEGVRRDVHILSVRDVSRSVHMTDRSRDVELTDASRSIRILDRST